MLTNTTDERGIEMLNISKQVDIDAPLAVVFETLLAQLGPDFRTMENKPFPFKLEAWPGGRWFRDLGNNTGHLWGHVQVIKPPNLLEIAGPLCMSYAATNFIQYRLTEQGGGTHLAFTHHGMGEILPEHRDGMPQGWAHSLEQIRLIAERRSGAGRGGR